MSCLIDQGGTFDCADLKPGGIEPFVMVYNLDDWKAATKTEGVNGEITAITNASTKQAYEFQGADETNIVPICELRPVEGNADKFDHQITAQMFEQTQQARTNISKMRFAKVVAIVYLNSGIGLVYGGNIGMRLNEIMDNPQDPNMGGSLGFVLRTKDTDPGEPDLPQVIDTGDPTTTKTLIEGLTTPGA